MTVKNDHLYVIHILECIEKIEEYVANDESKFRQNSLIQDATIRNLQILSESTQRISGELKEKHPSIPWRDISGFRNVLVHDYLGLDLDTVWSVIAIELPKIKLQLLDISQKLK